MQRVLIPRHIDRLAPPAGQLLALQGISMGTSWSVRLVGEAASTGGLQALLQARLDGIVAQMSHWQPDSALGRFNAAPAGSLHGLPDDFYTVLTYADAVAADSNGAWHPAVGALVNAWGFGAEGRYDQPGFTPPDAATVARLLALPHALELDHTRRTLRQPGGLLLDLSSVAKGYAVDCLAGCLAQRGLQHFLVEVGGELRGSGFKADGSPWWVELESPPAAGAASAAAMLCALHGVSVATSGDYRRAYCVDGQAYSHTIDPRSGAPVAHGVASVTVLHASCMAADALSTALTVLGAQEGMAYATERRLAARFLARDGAILVENMTPAFAALLE